MIIEFIGPPAAGKSTVEEVLVDALEIQPYERWAGQSRLDNIQRAGRALVSSPREARTLFNHLFETGQERVFYYPYLGIYGAAMWDFAARCPPNGICLFDQGPFQFLWAVGISGEDISGISEYTFNKIDKLSHKYVVIEIDVNAEVLKTRLEKRKNSRRIEQLSQEKFHRGIDLANSIGTHCSESDLVEYVCIDGETEPTTNVSLILESLSEIK